MMYFFRFSYTLLVKNSPANAGDLRCGFNPWVGKIPWRRKLQPTPVFLSGESVTLLKSKTKYKFGNLN